MSDADEIEGEYLIPRVRQTVTIFGKSFFADLIALDEAVSEAEAVAARSIGPFANAGDAWASATRQFWEQFRAER